MVKKSEPKLDIKDDEIAQAIDEFTNLKNHPAWQRIEKYYDNKIKYLETLLYEGEINDLQELKLIRARRNMALQLRNLPDILLEFIQKGEGGSPTLDPYS